MAHIGQDFALEAVGRFGLFLGVDQFDFVFSQTLNGVKLLHSVTAQPYREVAHHANKGQEIGHMHGEFEPKSVRIKNVDRNSQGLGITGHQVLQIDKHRGCKNGTPVAIVKEDADKPEGCKMPFDRSAALVNNQACVGHECAGHGDARDEFAAVIAHHVIGHCQRGQGNK